jgi:Mrp family chromosome partitioning ATPase
MVSPITLTETSPRSLALRDREHIASSQYITIVDRLHECGFGLDDKKTLGITSAVSGEGVTTIACNLALHLAFFTDCRVILVDANYSSPRLHRIFGIGPKPGLADLLGETAMESECIHDLADIDSRTLPRGLRRRIKRLSTNSNRPLLSGRAPSPISLSVLPAGEPNQNLVPSPTAKHDFIETVQSEFDIVIVDLPPILSQAKNNVNLASLDGNLFVIQAEQTTDQATRKSLQTIQQQGGDLTGVVLNRCRKRFSRRNSSSSK